VNAMVCNMAQRLQALVKWLTACVHFSVHLL